MGGYSAIAETRIVHPPKKANTHGCHLDHDVSVREVVGPHAVKHFLKSLDTLRGAPLQLKDDGNVQLCQLEAPGKSCLEYRTRKSGKAFATGHSSGEVNSYDTRYTGKSPHVGKK